VFDLQILTFSVVSIHEVLDRPEQLEQQRSHSERGQDDIEVVGFPLHWANPRMADTVLTDHDHAGSSTISWMTSTFVVDGKSWKARSINNAGG
jgi:hypothetical protein